MVEVVVVKSGKEKTERREKGMGEGKGEGKGKGIRGGGRGKARARTKARGKRRTSWHFCRQSANCERERR